MTDIASLGKVTEPGVIGIGVEKDRAGFKEVGGPGVRGLLERDLSSLVSIAAALRRSTEAVSSRPLRRILHIRHLSGTVVRTLKWSAYSTTSQ